MVKHSDGIPVMQRLRRDASPAAGCTAPVATAGRPLSVPRLPVSSFISLRLYAGTTSPGVQGDVKEPARPDRLHNIAA